MIEQVIKQQLIIEKRLQDNSRDTDWMKEIELFNLQLTHLQNERNYHLIVTMTVGLATLISCFFSIFYQHPLLILVDLVLMILFAAYILHYRKLENTTQQMYPTLEKAVNKIRES